jgi:hypothetical protein
MPRVICARSGTRSGEKAVLGALLRHPQAIGDASLAT